RLDVLTGPAPTAIYALSLHDALPILELRVLGAVGDPVELVADEHELSDLAHERVEEVDVDADRALGRVAVVLGLAGLLGGRGLRSEEHTSELQSRENLVCRLLLEKKK